MSVIGGAGSKAVSNNNNLICIEPFKATKCLTEEPAVCVRDQAGQTGLTVWFGTGKIHYGKKIPKTLRTKQLCDIRRRASGPQTTKQQHNMLRLRWPEKHGERLQVVTMIQTKFSFLFLPSKWWNKIALFFSWSLLTEDLKPHHLNTWTQGPDNTAPENWPHS